MKKRYAGVKFATLLVALGFLSPTVEVTYEPLSGMESVHFTLLSSVQARRGGGMRSGGMRMRAGGFNRGGMNRSFSRPRPSYNRSSFNRSSMRSPSTTRYQGGNFYKGTRPSSTSSSRRTVRRPKTQRQQYNTSRKNPVKTSSNRQQLQSKWQNMDAGKKAQVQQRVQNRKSSGKRLSPDQKQQIKKKWNTLDPNQKQQVRQKVKDKWNSKPINRPGEGNRPIHGKPDHGDGHHPHYGHHPHHGHHHHYHHYPYHGWGGYWPWFWGSAITVGAIVSTIPDNDCEDIYIDGKQYKECEGVLFEPVYKGDDVQYEVVEINK